MDNMELYNAVRVVPQEAQKTIQGGRLGGMTDINPMWRLMALTEQFGPCGVGWKYTIDKEWLESGANGESAAFVDISLYIKWDGQWSEAIPGTGGSSFVSKERNGLYTSDECFKMALTDAISVACKALGFGADIYWAAGRTKYSAPEAKPEPIRCEGCNVEILDTTDAAGKRIRAERWAAGTKEKFGKVLCPACVERQRRIEQAKAYVDAV